MVTKNSAKALFLGWLILAAPLLSLSQNSRVQERQTHHIKARGCVQPGNVPDCMVVNDFKAHRKYSVFFLSERPPIGSGISFEGLAYPHRDTHCWQGQKVQVTEWKPLGGEECRQTRK